MKFALFRIGGDSIVECPTMDEVWTYVRANGLCSEEITHEDMPPRRILKVWLPTWRRPIFTNVWHTITSADPCRGVKDPPISQT
jgi:hypothetical protein